MNFKTLASSLLFLAAPFNIHAEEDFDVEESKVLLSKLNGIVLLGSYDDLSRDAYSDVDGVKIVGLNVPGGKKGLKQLLSTYLDKPLTQDDLYALEKSIIGYYYENKHPLVMVKVPAQEATSGVLQIVVMESVLGKIEATGAKWFNNKRLARYIRLKTGEPIEEGTLLQDLFWMNRNPFRKSSVVYAAGQADGTTDIELVTKDRFPLRTYVGTDNTGIETVDRNRLYGGMNWGNAFGLDHFMTYQYTSSYNFSKFQAHTVHYTAPLSWRHVFIVFGGYSTVNAKNPVPGFKSHGSSYQASGRYNIPIGTGLKLLHEMTIGFDFKRTNNTVDFSEVPLFGKIANLTQFLTEYTMGYEAKRTKTSFIASLFFSPAQMVSDQTPSDFQSLRPFAKTKYVYGRVSLAEAIRLPGQCTLISTFRGQLSSANLLPSEQFGLGGYDTVRGYEERIRNYDNALVANAEFRTPSWKLFSSKKSSMDEGFQLLAFVDYGIGYNHKRIPGEKFSDFLISTGAGLRYNLNPYISARYDYGIKLHKIVGDRLFGRPHFSVSIGY